LTEENSDERRVYENHAAKIFTKNPPVPFKNIQTSPCPGKGCSATVDEFEINCKVCGSNFPSCVASGQQIILKEYYSCKYCKHKMLLKEMTNLNLKHCSMCH
jgi:WD repeat-containing protein 35